MASSFVGRFVNISVHGGGSYVGQIANVDPATQTLSINCQGHTYTWPKTHIASLTLCDSSVVSASAPAQPQPHNPPQAPAVTSSAPSLTPAVSAPAPAPVSAPAPVPSLTRAHASGAIAAPPAATPTEYAVPKTFAEKAETWPAVVPKSTASPRPEAAAAATVHDRKKSKANKKVTAAATGSPRVNHSVGAPVPNPNPIGFADDFDFSSALGKFDKKKAFEDFRNQDKTDPAELLVSHNKATPGIIQLVRGPNGVGPAPQSSTSAHRAARGDQDKLGLHEPVLSPDASERSFSRDFGRATSQSQSQFQSQSRSQSHSHSQPRSQSSSRGVPTTSDLLVERDDLRARVALLEALSGLKIDAAPATPNLGKRSHTYNVTTWRDHVTQGDATEGTIEGQLHFSAATIAAPSKVDGVPQLLEVRYLGVDEQRTDPVVYESIGKYHRGFTLRPQTAPVFVRRLRAAAFPTGE